MKTPKTTRTGLMAGLALCGLAFSAVAQHYPAGAEGIKAATLPPPGWYLRDYNFFYFSDDKRFGPNFEFMAYVNAPRLIWMTDKKILGANFGMDVIIPFGYLQVETSVPRLFDFQDDEFGLMDIQIEPVLLSWHTKQFDFAAAYAVWAPTGDFDPGRMVSLGKGFWTHMFTAGATWYPDKEKLWAISSLNRYEINHEQDDSRFPFTPDHTLTMEWGLSRTVCKGVDVGVVGYWQHQFTNTREEPEVVGLGPEASVFWSKIGLFASLRYVYEMDSEQRPEGHNFALTLTKPF